MILRLGRISFIKLTSSSIFIVVLPSGLSPSNSPILPLYLLFGLLYIIVCPYLKSFESAANYLEDAEATLSELVDKKDEIEGRRLFSWGKKEGLEKLTIQKEICDGALQVKRQLANTYHSYAGVKDICDFMKGDGVPPLKTQGFNYDSYSATMNDQDHNLSNRCVDVYKNANDGFTEIKTQISLISKLGCSD